MTQDRASQEKLAQVVVDSIKDRQTAQEASAVVQAESSQLDQVLEYLENTILPRARNSSFSGMVPLMENGKLTTRAVNSVQELEQVIADIKAAKVKLAAAELPKTNLPVVEVNSKSEAKRLGFLGKITSFFKN